MVRPFGRTNTYVLTIYSAFDNYSVFFGSALTNYCRDTFSNCFENCIGDCNLSAKSNDFCLDTFFLDSLGNTSDFFE